MNKAIAIIAGEPNSISSEIIFKSWKLKKKNFKKPLIIIGSINLLKLQKRKLGYSIKIKEIKKNFDIKKFNKNELQVLDVKFNQKKAFEKISKKSKKYIFRCFDIAIDLIKKNKVIGLINCPISKESLFQNKHQGITEFIAKKFKSKGKEVMLIYNKRLSVSPLTTHIPLKKVYKNINKFKIINSAKTINNFYRKFFKKKAKIAILGFNPHNFSETEKSEEKKIIIPAINTLKKLKINVVGPISPDSSFVSYKKNNFDVMLGMYHDQVLAPFKAIYKYEAINITLGLPCIRISPDHGVAENIKGKNIANPKSLIESIRFFNYMK